MKVRVEVIPWLADVFGGQQKSIAWEEDLDRETKVGDLLHSLATHQPKFGEIAFDAATGKFTAQVNVIHNDRLLQLPQEWDTPLQDGDSVILAPAFAGG